MFKYERVECPEPVEGLFYLYILECRDNSLYVGSTSHLVHRKHDHDTGKAAKWTKERRPVQLVYFEVHENLLAARQRELQVKGWTTSKKENLIFRRWGKLST